VEPRRDAAETGGAARPVMGTEARVQEYLRQGGCLFCGSPNTEGGSYDYQWPELGQKVRCLDCGRTWTDVYVLTRVEVPEQSPADPAGAGQAQRR
jgi:hypothetical protein